jgi:hypothetical protein
MQAAVPKRIELNLWALLQSSRSQTDSERDGVIQNEDGKERKKDKEAETEKGGTDERVGKKNMERKRERLRNTTWKERYRNTLKK